MFSRWVEMGALVELGYPQSLIPRQQFPIWIMSG
jgi:hypothetical protein